LPEFCTMVGVADRTHFPSRKYTWSWGT